MRHLDPEQCRLRLAELDLTVDILTKVLDLAAADIRGCTDFDAPGMRGYMFWSRANRYLAEELVPNGWLHTSRDSILRVVHPSMSHAITAMSGAGGVGELSSTDVRSKNPKGEATARMVERNGQGVLFTKEQAIYGKQLDEMPTWCLLYKRASDPESGMTAELSLPVRMDGKYINQWEERLPFELPDMGDPGADISMPDDPEDPDFVVEFLGG